jgi:hypothetical protein
MYFGVHFTNQLSAVMYMKRLHMLLFCSVLRDTVQHVENGLKRSTGYRSR